MQVVNKLTMIAVAVSDMPKAKAFYADKLGLKVTTDYRQDDDHWWVSLTLPEGGVTITLTTFHGNGKPGTMTLWFATSDITAATTSSAARESKSAKSVTTCTAQGRA